MTHNLLWERFSNQHGYFGKQLIVGHTVSEAVRVNESVICVDTGAFCYGVLSAYDVKHDVEYSSR